MSVGTNIRNRRAQLRMSQQDLADAMGYKTRSTIAKIESGENDVSQKKLQKFASVLNTTVEALISGQQVPEALGPETIPSVLRRNHNAAIILAGGRSGSNRQNVPSQFVNVHGKPIIVYCMEAYQNHPSIDDIYVVCLKGWENIVRAYAGQYGITKLRGVLPGGSSGMESLKTAVDFAKDRYSPEDMFIIQESTRPMVTAETISTLLQASLERGSATICHSMKEYVQFCMAKGKAEYVDRSTMIALQSPEAHRISLVTEVFEKAARQRKPIEESCFTMLMHRLGYEIHFIESSVNNIKIAREEDIAAFGALVKWQQN